MLNSAAGTTRRRSSRVYEGTMYRISCSSSSSSCCCCCCPSQVRAAPPLASLPCLRLPPGPGVAARVCAAGDTRPAATTRFRCGPPATRHRRCRRQRRHRRRSRRAALAPFGARAVSVDAGRSAMQNSASAVAAAPGGGGCRAVSCSQAMVAGDRVLVRVPLFFPCRALAPAVPRAGLRGCGSGRWPDHCCV